MKICIDIQSAIAQRAGVGRYTRALVEHLGEQCHTDEVSLFYFDFQRRGTPFSTPQMTQAAVRWCPGRIVQGSWKTLNWPPFDWFAGKADVYHFPNFIIPPLRQGRAIVTIHDVSFMRHPEFAETRNLQYLTQRIRDTVRRADSIITDSRFSAREIEELLGVKADRIFPIHLGISEHIAPPTPAAVSAFRSRMKLDRPYLLTVGTLEPRKNIPFLIEVFEQLNEFDGELVIAGMRGWKFEPILARMQASSRARSIRFVEYVADEDLPLLYGGAELFVFPSVYEGFGFPPLEAMACGTPVVSSAAASLAEVLGTGAEIVRSYAVEHWTNAITRCLTDSAHRQSLIDRGRRQAAQYMWSETAAKTWAVYRQVSS